jgi:hypothetical protein
MSILKVVAPSISYILPSKQRFMRREAAKTLQIGLAAPLSQCEFIVISPFFTSNAVYKGIRN